MLYRFQLPPNISLEDLIISYRKAKVNCFFEIGQLTALKFSQYEQKLLENLENLRDPIRGPALDFAEAGYAVILKNIEFANRHDDTGNNQGTKTYFSNAEQAWTHTDLGGVWFRIIGQLPVDLHVISSLWIEKVGCHLEEKITNNSYGCRLKRKSQSEGNFVSDSSGDSNRIDPLDLGHFRPYFQDYKNWQARGLEEAKKAISNGKDIIVITTDVKKFYHSIDAHFLLSAGFLEFLQVEYSPDQKAITQVLVSIIDTWSKKTFADPFVPEDLKRNNHCGIPVGLAASKVIANLLLAFFDSRIEEELGAIHFSRYVDDIIIVLPDNKRIKSAKDFWQFCSKRISEFKIDGNKVYFDTSYAHNSIIEFGNGKDKLFVLEGTSGQTFLETIKKSLDENSSEWRMMPEPDTDLEELNKQMTAATSFKEENVNSLRKSDGVSIQRLKFALKLRLFESAVDLLPRSAWTNELKEFFQLVYDFILLPEKLDTYTKYHPRILKLAIKANWPEEASRIWDRIENAWDKLSDKAKQKGLVKDVSLISMARDYNRQLLTEAIYMSVSPDRNSYE
jgi:Reverse transcriptase (RNA-dependent DNA polymerase).